MASNNINILASTFSYATTSKTAEGMKDILVKFLVTGFDPLLIESIKITSKVARVITSEKDFHTVPGAKLLISGTNNILIDVRQEIEEVFTDGFSFNIDVPDNYYTDGLTYSVPSLGWSLLERDSTRLLLKTGSSAINEKCLLIEKINMNGYFTHQTQIVYGAKNFKTIKNNIKVKESKSQIPFSEFISYGASDTIYWLYGDDSFIYISACRNPSFKADRFSKFHNCASFCFGELSSIDNSIPFDYLLGGGNEEIIYGVSESNNNVVFTYNITFAGVSSYKIDKDMSIGVLSGLKDMSYNSNFISGQDRSYLNYLLPTKQKIFPFEIYTKDYIALGSLPGTYFLQEFIPGLTNLAYKPQKLTFNNKKRNCLYIGISRNNNLGSILIDLTGPIR